MHDMKLNEQHSVGFLSNIYMVDPVNVEPGRILTSSSPFSVRYLNTHIYPYNIYTQTHIHTHYTYTHLHIHSHTHSYPSTCSHIHSHICSNTHTCIHLCYTNSSTHTYICTHIYMHLHTYLHIHAHSYHPHAKTYTSI